MCVLCVFGNFQPAPAASRYYLGILTSSWQRKKRSESYVTNRRTPLDTHTHTHPIGKEERTHTEALAKTLNLFCFFCRGGPGCCGASGTGAVVHPHRWKSRLGLTGLQHGPAHTRLARCARAQVPLSFKVTATATARGHLCRFDKANVRDGHIFGN